MRSEIDARGPIARYSETGRPELRNCALLFLLGDSISLGYGPFLEQMLAGRFTCDRKGSELLTGKSSAQDILRRLAALDSNLPSLNGGDSNQVLAYMQAKAVRRMPDCNVLLLNCGLHDLRRDPNSGERQVEPEDYARNLDEIIRLGVKASQWVIWASTTPVTDGHHNRMNPEFQRFNADVLVYNAIAAERMNQAGIPSIDLYTFTGNLGSTADHQEDLLIDHVHFNETTRRLQAAYIAGWLEAGQYA